MSARSATRSQVAIDTRRHTCLISGIAAGVTLRLRKPMPNSSIVYIGLPHIWPHMLIGTSFLRASFTAMSIIRSMPETLDVQVTGSRVSLEMQADDEKLAELMNRLIAERVGMHSFADKDPTLEDVFMMVTKGLVV